VLAEVGKELAANNSISPDDKERLVAELGAGRVLLTAKSARADAVESILHKPLVWIAAAAAALGAAVLGAVAEKAVGLLSALLGLG
jgi:hypothetical protein